MKKTFTYQKAPFSSIFILAFIMLAFLPIMAAFPIIDSLSGGTPVDSGLLIISGVLVLIFCGGVLKMADVIKTTIVLEDQGMAYNSIIKKIFIPWQDIVQIQRLDLTTTEYFPNLPPPADMKIQTKNYGNLYIFQFLKLDDRESNCDEMARLIEEFSKKSQWSYASDDWKAARLTKRRKNRIIIGVVLMALGCFVPLLSQRMQSLSRLTDTIGVPGTALFFIAFGLYTALAKDKEIK